jgi:hypothetical protein
MKESEFIKTLDRETLNFVIHKLAGVLKNARGCAKSLKDGKVVLSSGRNINDMLSENLQTITDFIKEIKED